MSEQMTPDEVEQLVRRSPFHQWLGLKVLSVQADGVELKAAWRSGCTTHSSRPAALSSTPSACTERTLRPSHWWNGLRRTSCSTSSGVICSDMSDLKWPRHARESGHPVIREREVRRDRAYASAPCLLDRPPARAMTRKKRASWRHHHFADHFAVADQAQALGGLFEREHLLDQRAHLALRDHVHQRRQILVVEAVRADDLQLEAPHVAQIFLRVVAGGGAAHEQLAAALEAAQRRMPRVAAGKVDHHV